MEKKKRITSVDYKLKWKCTHLPTICVQNAMETITSHPVGGLIGRLQSSRLENADGK